MLCPQPLEGGLVYRRSSLNTCGMNIPRAPEKPAAHRWLGFMETLESLSGESPSHTAEGANGANVATGARMWHCSLGAVN